MEINGLEDHWQYFDNQSVSQMCTGKQSGRRGEGENRFSCGTEWV